MNEILPFFFSVFIQCKPIYNTAHMYGRFMHTTFKEKGNPVTEAIDCVWKGNFTWEEDLTFK